MAETTPAGVEVLVDGIVVGKTPLERSDLRSGVREVTLQHPHYETVRESNQRFDDGRVVRIQRALVRGRGALTVTVKPREAWVEVEGKRLAERTPVTLEDLPAGRMEVRLGAANHRPMAVEVDIVKDGLARLETGTGADPLRVSNRKPATFGRERDLSGFGTTLPAGSAPAGRGPPGRREEGGIWGGEADG